MESGTGRSAPCEDETPKWRKRRFKPVDFVFEVTGVELGGGRLLDTRADPPPRVGKLGADGEQVALDPFDHCCQVGLAVRKLCANESQARSQFVDVPERI